MADAVAVSNGTASLDVGALQMPINGSLRILGPKGAVLSDTGGQRIWAGNVYQVSMMQQTPYVITPQVIG